MDCQTALNYLFEPSEKPRKIVLATEKDFREFWDDAITNGLYTPGFLTAADRAALFGNTCQHLADSTPEDNLQSCIVFRPVSAETFTCRISMFWGFYQSVQIVWSRKMAQIIIVTSQPVDEV